MRRLLEGIRGKKIARTVNSRLVSIGTPIGIMLVSEGLKPFSAWHLSDEAHFVDIY